MYTMLSYPHGYGAWQRCFRPCHTFTHSCLHMPNPEVSQRHPPWLLSSSPGAEILRAAATAGTAEGAKLQVKLGLEKMGNEGCGEKRGTWTLGPLVLLPSLLLPHCVGITVLPTLVSPHLTLS